MSGRRPPLTALAAALLVLAGGLAVAGCGASRPTVVDGALSVGLAEYRILPQSVRAQPGVLVVTIHNYGRLSHDLAISRNGTVIATSPPVAPGQTDQLVAALTPGTYLMASTLLDDQSLGAYGTLTVP